MLDNLGLGELFGLALLALMFFGPKQLPEIGARLGRWIRGLTQYSSAFLAEWREEALAVHDAVQEVKGIRDEIVAAQAEIAGTLDTARAEMDDAVSGARQDAQQQIRTAGTMPTPQDATASTMPTPQGAAAGEVEELRAQVRDLRADLAQVRAQIEALAVRSVEANAVEQEMALAVGSLAAEHVGQAIP
jgi:Sec-independent protein translocase protein TatA